MSGNNTEGASEHPVILGVGLIFIPVLVFLTIILQTTDHDGCAVVLYGCIAFARGVVPQGVSGVPIKEK